MPAYEDEELLGLTGCLISRLCRVCEDYPGPGLTPIEQLQTHNFLACRGRAILLSEYRFEAQKGYLRFN